MENNNKVSINMDTMDRIFKVWQDLCIDAAESGYPLTENDTRAFNTGVESVIREIADEATYKRYVVCTEKYPMSIK